MKLKLVDVFKLGEHYATTKEAGAKHEKEPVPTRVLVNEYGYDLMQSQELTEVNELHFIMRMESMEEALRYLNLNGWVARQVDENTVNARKKNDHPLLHASNL